MKKEPLWYIRRKGGVTGPFPVGLIERYVVLGRVAATTELSPDKLHWAACADWPEWVTYVEGLKQEEQSEEQLEAMRRWQDERSGYDRRMGTPANVELDQRRDNDRRKTETAEEIELRRHRHQGNGLARRYSLRAVAMLTIVMVGFLAVYLALYIPPATQEPIDCLARAEEGVNWSYCDLQRQDISNISLRHSNLQSSNMTGSRLDEVDLSDSELSFSLFTFARISDSNFSNSRMTGVSFRNALIYNVDFSGADLAYADFSNAELSNVEFKGARLDYAIWLDQRRCAEASIGICR